VTEVRQRARARGDVIINGVFTAQGLTGQQRFASEVSSRLPTDRFELLVPPGPCGSYPLTRHLWTNTLFAGARRSVSLSLTHQLPLLGVRSRAEAITVHDLFPILHPEWYTKRYAAVASRLLERAIRRASVIFTVSEPVKDSVASRFAPTGRLVVTPNAPSDIFRTPLGPSDVAEALRPLGLVDGEYLLVGAAMDGRKRLDVILSGVARLNASPRLVMIGERPAVVPRAAGLRDLPSGVTWLGRVTDGQLAALYAGCRAFVTASDDEGFGLPAVEAASMGARVVASDIPVHRWTLGELASYFEPGNADHLADVLDSIPEARLTDSDTRQLADRFSWDATAEIIGARVLDLARAFPRVPWRA
jgi:glycosyltransferase involved in cell wall biosynthesis